MVKQADRDLCWYNHDELSDIFYNVRHRMVLKFRLHLRLQSDDRILFL